MNAGTNRCDHKRIDAFLASDPDELRDAPLVAHLDVCSRCRDYMEQSAAAPQKWSEAATCLLASEFDLSSSIEYSAASLEIGKPDIPTSIQNVLDSLAPSDDPHRLGRLGGYEISGIIGVGGMGVVLKAVDTALDRVVAIKVMAPHLASHATARKRFAREAKAAAAVLHPNVIPIHSVSSDEATPYLVMGYVRGGSLQKRLDHEGTLSTIEILRIGSQIAAGLSAAHEQGLVHRDIKPENILLEEGVERLTLTDFGLARAVDDASLTQHGAIAGTPQYMSPEQARGEPVDQASDLFSLGSVLYTLCTGRVPFRAESSHSVMRKIIDEAPTPIRELNPEIPDWLVSIIDQLLAKDKKNRFPSAEELHTLLDACLSHVQQPTAVDLPESLRSAQRIKQRPLFLAALGSLLMTTVFTTLLWLTGALAFLVQESPRPQTSNERLSLQQENGVDPIDRRDSFNLAFFNEGPVLIKGRIENAQNKQVLLLNSELTGEVEHVLNLDKEGNFEFQFEVLSAHDIAIKTNGKRITLFASPQDSIYLEVDISRFDETLTFKGSNAGTNKSLNVFRRKFLEHLEEKQFLLKKRDLQPAAFKHFAEGFFNELEKEVVSIADKHGPDTHGVEWMNTYIKYRHGEDLLEYGSHHRDRLPDDYYDFESEFKTTNKYALECSQYYDDFALKYHISHKLSSRPEFFGIIAAFQDQNFEGVKTTFEFLGANVDNNLVKTLVITQMMTQIIESDHATAQALLPVYSSIVPDINCQNFVKRRIDSKRQEKVLVSNLKELENSETLGEIIREINTAHKGKVLYIDLWATWCQACLNTFPSSKRLSNELKDVNVVQIYLCVQSTEETWREVSEKFSLPSETNYYLTKMQSRELSRLFKCYSFPRYIIVDQRGAIVDQNAKQPFSRALKTELIRIVECSNTGN